MTSNISFEGNVESLLTQNQQRMNVAIDGPAGAGKSTVSRHVANALGYIYVDTGAMYRSITWKMLRLGIPVSEQDAVVRMTQETDIRLLPHPDGQQVFVDGVEVTRDIRSAEVTSTVSEVSKIPGVRAYLVERQKRLADDKGVVMDGRDIGTNVLPDAEVKIYMTAGVGIRAARRYKELQSSGRPAVSIDNLAMEIEERDRMDRERDVSPLTQAEDAVYLDTTDMTIDEVVQSILTVCREKSGGRNP